MRAAVPGMLRWLLVIVLIAATRRVEAFDCEPPKTSCEAAQRAAVIFVGKVTRVVSVEGGSEVTMAVDEAFAGAPGKTVAIRATGMASYGRFVVGEQLLVYANPGASGELSVGGCSRTGPLATRATDVAELRAAARRGTGRIFGLALADGMPRPNVAVRVAGRSATTNARGEYALELPPGKHVVEVTPDPLLASQPQAPVELRVAGCVKRDFSDRANGRIAGTLRDAAGKPVADAIVRAFPSGTVVPALLEPGTTWLIGTSARSNAKGEYELGPLPPATYRVAVGAPLELEAPYPPTYHADVALGRGARVPGIDLVLPPRHQVFQVSGRVRVTGALPPGAALEVTLTDTRSGRTQRFHASPTFQRPELAGAVVEVKVCANALDCTTSKPVRLDRDLSLDLELVIR